MALNMRLDIKVKENLDDFMSDEQITKAMHRLGIEAETHIKDTINTFVRSDTGRKQGVHTGAFRDSVRVTRYDKKGFEVSDGVPYGIYHEFGTEKHFVPFADKQGNLTPLGQWAVLNFQLLGFGSQSKRRSTREEIVKSKGGMMVSLDEMAPFRKAIKHIEQVYPKIFKEVLEDHDSTTNTSET